MQARPPCAATSVRAVLLAAALLASGLLAGCAAPGPAPDEVAPASDAAPPPAPEDLPDNRSGSFAAFRETNLTSGASHAHDYWGGRMRVEIMRDVVEMRMTRDATAVDVLRPPVHPDSLVFEGTAAVEIAVSSPRRQGCVPFIIVNGAPVCTSEAADPAPPAGVRVSFLHAASGPAEWADAGVVAWDAPLRIDVADPRWTDMPHSTASLWAFRFDAADLKETTLVFDVVVTVLRAEGPIARWPGHPDFYAGSSRRVVHDAPAHTREIVSGTFLDLDGFVVPEKLVSAGTRSLLVYANVTSVSGPVPPTNWALYFHNASARQWNITDPVTPATTEPKRDLLWLLRVDDGAMDTPYATGSRWELMLRGVVSSPTGGSCIGGCAQYEVDYHLTVVATDQALDGYARSFWWGDR